MCSCRARNYSLIVESFFEFERFNLTIECTMSGSTVSTTANDVCLLLTNAANNLNAVSLFLGSCSQVEFAVQMTGAGCVQDLEETLKNVGTVDIDQKTGRVLINSNVPWVEIQERIEKTGRKAVLSGFGGNKFCLHYSPRLFRNGRQTIK